MKRGLIVFLCVALLLLISGCGQQTLNSSPPEPYKLAKQEIEAQNSDKALHYLDLVIKNFPDNKEYFHKAHLLRIIILTKCDTTNSSVSNNIFELLKIDQL